VLDDERVVALTPAAARQGVQPGMRRGGVAAIAPGVLMLERDPAAEQAALDAAAQAVLHFTPRVEQAVGEHSLVLDIGASLALFGGPRNLGRQALARVRALGLRSRLGMAPTPAGARLLACRPGRRVRRRVLRLPALSPLLDTLPCPLLPAAGPYLDWLDNIGCHTLGDLRRLPRAGLQRRCSPALLQALDAAHGRASEGWRDFVPPAHFLDRCELSEHVDRSDAVRHPMDHLSARLCAWLDERQLAATRLVFGLEHERGRHARPPTSLELALAEPAWLPQHLDGPLRERLARTALPAPVIAVSLDVRDLAARPDRNAALFPDPAAIATDHGRLLDLLRARLGAEGVAQAAARADHRPEVANTWTAGPPASSGRAPPPPSVEPPCWLLSPPQLLDVRQDRPVHGSPLRLVHGPERIESGWWDRSWTLRDYFVAEDDRAVRYWIYRERDADPARWFLHGMFG